MAIVVETGLIVAGANSFVSLDSFQTYCEDRNRTYTAYTEVQQEAALIQAGQYLNNLVWKGIKTNRTNPMCWPRYGDDVEGNIWNQLVMPASAWVGVLDKDGFYIDTASVPVEVINAQCESAWLILTGTNLTPVLERGGQVKREKVDVIETEYFSGASPRDVLTPVADNLKGLLKSSTTMTIARA